MFWKKKPKVQQQDPIIIEWPLPTFKYHKDPIKTGVIKEETIICECCGKQSRYKYEGPIYSIEEINTICPYCISDGTMYKKYDAQFSDFYQGDVDQKHINEFLHHNPGYTSWQTNEVPVHCKDFTEFIGYVGYKEIQEMGLEATLQSQIESNSKELCQNIEDFKNAFVNNGQIQGYLFRCLTCKKYILHVDFT